MVCARLCRSDRVPNRLMPDFARHCLRCFNPCRRVRTGLRGRCFAAHLARSRAAGRFFTLHLSLRLWSGRVWNGAFVTQTCWWRGDC